MNITEHLLVCLSEECAEVAQEVSKALRFGLSEVMPGQPLTNEERIAREFVDLLAVYEILEMEGYLPRIFDFIDFGQDALQKQKKVRAFMNCAQKVGTLTFPTSSPLLKELEE